ncbi:hypothetical protein [Lacipirellula sp.]|uniref:hypothetical protein n=1 Tax=Lacipirellula sp. TaxID=2691419 RepID=UPI003D0F12E3
MSQQLKAPPTKPPRSLSRGERVGIRFFDVLMGWIAVSSYANLAFGVSSFFHDTNIAGITTPQQRWQWVALRLTMTIVGFAYMLWRQKWRCSLSDILLAMTYWCILFVLARTSGENPNTVWVIAFGCLAAMSFAYVLLWAFTLDGVKGEQRVVGEQ